MHTEFLKELEQYLQDHLHREYQVIEAPLYSYPSYEEMDNFLKKNKQPVFSETLFRFIEEKKLTDAEVYKKAGIDRRHFSKIRNPEYKPRKKTALLLALALELTADETDALLSSAGYSLSGSSRRDLIVQFFMKQGIYDLNEIEEALAIHMEEGLRF
ncbi:XRE family transcriptional regulator [Bacillus mangrovi]|uniref:XRE family transcriptional regulator n=1 Tax=Metabacillus mangrovi TaxID=1491830 RepID=A0A7X2S6N5_9BACI|nr:XRE family transcriptional regulator [Metabacillus mangrovi]MTH54265.1 XRE family transcriptional regulator [Metabacillus mangrovi]